MKNNIEILISNYKAEEGSFIYTLHEKNYFDKDLFWSYYNCILNITESTLDKPIDKEISKMIFHTYDYFLKSIIWHLSPNDLSKIENLPLEEIYLYIERLSIRIKNGYFEKRHINEDIFNDELVNPYYKQDKI
jgi:hypothetical protein